MRFVFTERGVYRPGDDVHIGIVVKQRNWNGKLGGLPVETEVVDARDHPGSNQKNQFTRQRIHRADLSNGQ
jgi:uncharacterized protein YfaS (alpha-2-macroglobulin family)